MKKAIKWILIIFCVALVLGTATLILRTVKDNVNNDDPKETTSNDAPVTESYTYISGKYKFVKGGSGISFTESVKFTYDGEEFVRVEKNTNNPNYPSTAFVRADGSVFHAECMGLWTIKAGEIVDFGTTPQRVTKAFEVWFNISFDPYVPTDSESDPDTTPETDPVDPDDSTDPAPEASVLSKITLETLPKTQYVEGEQFEVTNGIIKIEYSDGVTNSINLESSHVSGWIEAFRTGAGTYTLTVKYTEGVYSAETTYQITIVAAPEDEDPVVPELTNTISGTYTFAENASCFTVDQRVNFMHDGDGYSAVRSGTNADGDPVTYFDWEDGGSHRVQCMGVWEIDTTKPIDFGTTPQAVSAEFLAWVNASLIKQN